MVEFALIALQITLFYGSLNLGVLLTEWMCQRGAVMDTYDPYSIRPKHVIVVFLAIGTGVIASQLMWLAHVLCFLIGLLAFKFYSRNSTPRILSILLVSNIVAASGNILMINIATLAEKLGELAV